MVAAALKLWGLNVSPFAQHGWLSSALVQVAAVQWEIVLGLWLLSGYAALGAWALAIFTFLLFAGVSFHLGWIGQASCGCFGAVKASPWTAFTVDLGILAVLLSSRCFFGEAKPTADTQERQWIPPGAGLIAGACACLLMLVGAASFAFGSPAAALAYIRGERFSVRPGIVDVGAGRAGEIVEAPVELVNWTDRPVLVYGGTSDCSCLAIADLPVTIAPGEARQVMVQVKLPAGARGLFSRKAFFRTDCDQARIVAFSLSGVIESNP